MAKVGFWLRGSRGKFANAALQKDANGDTIIREIVQPTNPRTPAQTVQRVIVNTVAQAYSAMKAICDHSFEGKSNPGLNMTQFMARNTNAMRANLASQIGAGLALADCYAYSPLGTKQVVPFKYIVSEGSLPEIQSRNGNGMLYAPQLGGFGASISYENIINTLGLQRGDQLTFIFLVKDSYGTKFKYARVILDPQENGEAAPLNTAFITNNKVNKPNSRNQGSLYVAYETNPAGVSFDPDNSFHVVAGAIIASRKENEKWLRSYAAMAIWEEMLTEYASMQDCVGNATRSISFMSNRYLNNALPDNSTSSDGRPGIMMIQTRVLDSDPWVTATGNVVNSETALQVRMVGVNVDSDYQMILDDDNHNIGDTIHVGPSGSFWNEDFDGNNIATVSNLNWGPVHAYIGKKIDNSNWECVAKSPYTFTGTNDEP